MCELSRDYSAYRHKVVAVRGVYYYGLRQACEQTCATEPWPSFLDLVGGDDAGWAALAAAERTVGVEAATGKQFEIWVTAVGKLDSTVRLSPLGPCDKSGSRYFGYGHLGVFPAQLRVESFRDIKVVESPISRYDYNLYRRPVL
jgi:hypothetical protein